MTEATADQRHIGDDEPNIATHVVDASGLACPMPVIELARAVDQIDVGDQVLLIATDPAARVDVPIWCRMQRQRLIRMEERDGSVEFLVERAR